MLSVVFYYNSVNASKKPSQLKEENQVKINKVEAMVLTCQLDKPIMDATYTLPHRSAVLVRVDTDEGISGIGEAAYFTDHQ